MTDPGAGVYFTEFAPAARSPAAFLCAHLSATAVPPRDEVNRAIDRMARENDINIAFNQLEAYLHDRTAAKKQLVQGKEKDDGALSRPDRFCCIAVCFQSQSRRTICNAASTVAARDAVLFQQTDKIDRQFYLIEGISRLMGYPVSD